MKKNIVGLLVAILMIFTPLNFNSYESFIQEKVTTEVIPIYFDDYLAEMVGNSVVYDKSLPKPPALKAILEAYISDWDFGDDGIYRVEKILENPDNKKYFLAEISGFYEGSELVFIEFDNGLITYAQSYGTIVPNSASAARLEGFKGSFAQVYTSQRMGNGEMRLLKFEKGLSEMGVFNVLDCHLEQIEYPEIAWEMGISGNRKISFAFGEDDDTCYLIPEYNDINKDGYADIRFSGVQRVFDADEKLLAKLRVELIYLYNDKENEFVLDEARSKLPYGWRWRTGWR